jgi:hypothetical protein
MLAIWVALFFAASFFVYRDAEDDALLQEGERAQGSATAGVVREQRRCERLWPKLWFC